MEKPIPDLPKMVSDADLRPGEAYLLLMSQRSTLTALANNRNLDSGTRTRARNALDKLGCLDEKIFGAPSH